MRRTFAVPLVPAVVIAAAWLRLEHRSTALRARSAVVALALLPALVAPARSRGSQRSSSRLGARRVDRLRRLAAPSEALPRRGRLALRRTASSTSTTCRTPFDPRVHAEMRGAILAAVFGFVARARRSPSRHGARSPRSLVVLAGAGWPATLARQRRRARRRRPDPARRPRRARGPDDAARASRRRSPLRSCSRSRRSIASASAAVAKGGLVSWQRWDPYTAPQPAGRRLVRLGRAVQRHPLPEEADDRPRGEGAAPLALLARRRARRVHARPLGARRCRCAPTHSSRAPASTLLRQDVQVLALADTHLVGASVPLRYDAGDAPLVTHVPGIATLPSGLTRGFRYTAWSYAPRADRGAARCSPSRTIRSSSPSAGRSSTSGIA